MTGNSSSYDMTSVIVKRQYHDIIIIQVEEPHSNDVLPLPSQSEGF